MLSRACLPACLSCLPASITNKGNQHTVRGNELAMTSAQRLVDADWAMEILALANAKMKCSATTHAIAVQVLAESGRLGEACLLYTSPSPRD